MTEFLKFAENEDYFISQFWSGIEYCVVIRYKHIGAEWLFDTASTKEEADHLLALAMNSEGVY